MAKGSPRFARAWFHSRRFFYRRYRPSKKVTNSPSSLSPRQSDLHEWKSPSKYQGPQLGSRSICQESREERVEWDPRGAHTLTACSACWPAAGAGEIPAISICLECHKVLRNDRSTDDGPACTRKQESRRSAQIWQEPPSSSEKKIGAPVLPVLWNVLGPSCSDNCLGLDGCLSCADELEIHVSHRSLPRTKVDFFISGCRCRETHARTRSSVLSQQDDDAIATFGMWTIMLWPELSSQYEKSDSLSIHTYPEDMSNSRKMVSQLSFLTLLLPADQTCLVRSDGEFYEAIELFIMGLYWRTIHRMTIDFRYLRQSRRKRNICRRTAASDDDSQIQAGGRSCRDASSLD